MRCWPRARLPAASNMCSARPTRSIWRAASASRRFSSARSRRSAAARTPLLPRRWAPMATFSSTVIWPSRRTCWKVRLMPRRAMSRAASAAVDSPRKAILPSVAGLTAEMQLNMVLLPAPFGPISAITSLACTVRLMLCWRPGRQNAWSPRWLPATASRKRSAAAWAALRPAALHEPRRGKAAGA